MLNILSSKYSAIYGNPGHILWFPASATQFIMLNFLGICFYNVCYGNINIFWWCAFSVVSYVVTFKVSSSFMVTYSCQFDHHFAKPFPFFLSSEKLGLYLSPDWSPYIPFHMVTDFVLVLQIVCPPFISMFKYTLIFSYLPNIL